MHLNPHHPTGSGLRDQWHKVAALIMLKLGATEVEITAEDIERLSDIAIVAKAFDDALTFTLVDGTTGRALARQAGGLPS